MKSEGNEKQEVKVVKKKDVGVIACGGGANKIIVDIHGLLKDMKTSRVNLKLTAVNTDEDDLEIVRKFSEKKINTTLIGSEKISGGYGAGQDPDYGYNAALESSDDITELIESNDFFCIIVTLGGGTGSGSSVFVAEKLTETMLHESELPFFKQKFGVMIVVMPFIAEGKEVNKNANEALAKLQTLPIPTLIFQNDLFYSHAVENINNAETIPTIRDMYFKGNQIIARMIAKLVRIMAEPHTDQNLDFVDLMRIFSMLQEGRSVSHTAFCGIGYGYGADRAKDAIVMASQNSYIESNLLKCKRVLMSVDAKGMNMKDLASVHEFCLKFSDNDNQLFLKGLSSDYLPGKADEAESEIAVFIMGIGYFPDGDELPSGDFTKALLDRKEHKPTIEKYSGKSDLPEKRFETIETYVTQVGNTTNGLNNGKLPTKVNLEDALKLTTIKEAGSGQN